MRKIFARLSKRQTHKMVKHTQTICRLLSTNCLSVFDHFVGLALKGSKATDNSLKTSVTQNLNDTSNQDSVGYKLTETSNSKAAKISKHKNPTIK